jgi:hypothetical protein
MAWKFDAVKLEIVWVVPVSRIIEVSASIDMTAGDLAIDTGLRENEGVIDQGSRVID